MFVIVLEEVKNLEAHQDPFVFAEFLLLFMGICLAFLTMAIYYNIRFAVFFFGSLSAQNRKK